MRAITLAVCIVMILDAEGNAQRTRLDVDHVFIMVPRDASSESQLLRNHGFVVDTTRNRHVGQGTASRGVYFGNAYIELLWADPDVRIDDDESRAFAERVARASNWKQSTISPFGVGVRRVNAGDSITAPHQRHTAAWMRPGTVMEILTPKGEPNAFELFVVPEYMAVPAWIGGLREKRPHYLAHSTGAQSITAVEIRGPASHRPHALSAVEVAQLRFTEADEALLVIELDGGVKGKTVDLRPGLPVVVRR